MTLVDALCVIRAFEHQGYKSKTMIALMEDARAEIHKHAGMLLAVRDAASPPQDKPTGEAIRALDRANIDERFNGRERIGEADRRVRKGWAAMRANITDDYKLRDPERSDRRKPQGGE